MAKYAGKLVTSFVLLLLAFVLLFICLFLKGWYVDSSGASFSYSGATETFSGYIYSAEGDSTRYTNAIKALLITAISLTGIDLLLTVIMMFASFCSHITKGMTYVPKFTIIAAIIAGLLTEIACGLFLIKIYAADSTLSLLKYPSVTPSYCFFLACLTGFALLIASCVNCGIHYNSVVENAGMVIAYNSTQVNGQGMQQSMSMAYPTSQFTYQSQSQSMNMNTWQPNVFYS